MQVTPRLGIRVPDGPDAPDVPMWTLRLAQDVEASLQVGVTADRPTAGKPGRRYYSTDFGAEAVDTGATWELIAPPPPVVTTLPASARDGQDIYLKPTTETIWHLRYNASSASPYKWEAVGAQSALWSHVADEASTPSPSNSYSREGRQ